MSERSLTTRISSSMPRLQASSPNKKLGPPSTISQNKVLPTYHPVKVLLDMLSTSGLTMIGVEMVGTKGGGELLGDETLS